MKEKAFTGGGLGIDLVSMCQEVSPPAGGWCERLSPSVYLAGQSDYIALGLKKYISQ
jgi:hypothetical protein